MTSMSCATSATVGAIGASPGERARSSCSTTMYEPGMGFLPAERTSAAWATAAAAHRHTTTGGILLITLTSLRSVVPVNVGLGNTRARDRSSVYLSAFADRAVGPPDRPVGPTGRGVVRVAVRRRGGLFGS